MTYALRQIGLHGLQLVRLNGNDEATAFFSGHWRPYAAPVACIVAARFDHEPSRIELVRAKEIVRRARVPLAKTPA